MQRLSLAAASALIVLGPSTRLAVAGSVSMVGVTLEQMAAKSELIVVARVLAPGSHQYPADEAPQGVAGGLRFLEVEIEEVLKAPAKGPARGARIKVFDPMKRFTYEHTELIKSGVVSYADTRYRPTIKPDAVKPGRTLLIFLRAAEGAGPDAPGAVPPHFPAGSFFMFCGESYDAPALRPRVTKLIAAPPAQTPARAGAGKP